MSGLEEDSGVAVIVTAEDDPDIREIICQLLERHGHTVIAVEDGAAAVQYARAVGPDLILLDGDMGPGMSGFEASHRLRTDADLAHIPVIMVTGSLEPAVIRVQLPHLTDVVAKPFRHDDLMHAVEQALAGSCSR